MTLRGALFASDNPHPAVAHGTPPQKRAHARTHAMWPQTLPDYPEPLIAPVARIQRTSAYCRGLHS